VIAQTCNPALASLIPPIDACRTRHVHAITRSKPLQTEAVSVGQRRDPVVQGRTINRVNQITQPLHAATRRKSHLGGRYVIPTWKVQHCGQERPSLCFERLSKQLNKESTTNKIHLPRTEFAKIFLSGMLADSAAVRWVHLTVSGLRRWLSRPFEERLPRRITGACMPSQAPRLLEGFSLQHRNHREQVVRPTVRRSDTAMRARIADLCARLHGQR
jgi:hypothetical protein